MSKTIIPDSSPVSSPVSSKELISSLNFCVLDLETTGGNHEKDRIIEIGLVRVRNLEITDSKNLLLDPKIKIPEFIQKLTSISQKDVTGKPTIDTVIDDILNFIGDDIIVAHNTSFDVPFLNAVLKRVGKKELTENKVICTNVMTKHLIPQITSSNLGYMSELFQLKHNNAHRALDDAKAAAELLICYLYIFLDKGIQKVNQLYYPKNKFELNRINLTKEQFTQSFDSIATGIETCGHITFKGEKGTILGIVPSQNFKEDMPFIKDLERELDWKVATIKITHPFLDSLLYFCSHYAKLETKIQTKITKQIQDKIGNQEVTKNIEQYDFIITNHLIKEQLTAYSFLNLNLKAHNIFKFPGQQKKMYQYLLSSVNRFESNQKGKRKTFIPKELTSLVEAYLAKHEKEYLFLSKKQVKESSKDCFKFIESYTTQVRTDFNYPKKHL